MTGMETSQRAETVRSWRNQRTTAHLKQKKMERKAVIRMVLLSPEKTKGRSSLTLWKQSTGY